MPTVTVLIPTYRRPKLLRRAILSALRQTLADVLVGVFDNNSGDETGQVVAELASKDSRVRYFVHPTNIGMIKNQQFGVDQVETPYFSILSDDDFLLPGFLLGAVEALEQAPDCAFAAAQVIMVDARRRLTARPPDHFPPGRYEPPEGAFRLLEFGFLTAPGILWRTNVVRTAGWWDERFGYHWDLEFQTRIASRFPFLSLDLPGAVFTQDGNPDYRKDNRYLLDEYENLKLWTRAICEDYGLSSGDAEELAGLVRRRYAGTLYHNAIRNVHVWTIGELERALSILGELDYHKKEKLERLLRLIRGMPSLVRLFQLTERLRNTRLYGAVKRRRGREKYGKFLAFEEPALFSVDG